jgi:alkylation response protein AidB-like acyl-CoA dehydrogenase
VSIDIELNEEIARGASRFLAARMPIKPTGPFPSSEELKSVWTELLGLGWPYVLATDHGSSAGASQVEAIFRSIGRHPIIGPTIDMFIGLPLTWRAAEEVAQQLLEPYMMGEKLLAMARLTETPDQRVSPDVWAGCRFSADRISGFKTLVDNVELCDALLVHGLDGDEPVLLLVDAAAAGVRVEKLSTPDLSRRFAMVHFEQVAATVLVRGTQALQVEQAIERFGRLATVAELCGLAETGLAMAVDYAKLRKQFGRTIGSFQAIKHLLAEGKMLEYGLSCVSTRLAEEMEEAVDGDGGALAATRALCYASRSAQSVFDIALQVHGGIGFTLEYGLSWSYNRAAGLWGLWGDSNSLALQLGRRQCGCEPENGATAG